MGLALALAVIFTWLLYGAFYSTVGASLAARLCWAGAVWNALTLLVYAKSRRYGVLLWLTWGGGQLFLVAVHLALGGLTSSAYVLIYTLTPLLVYHTVDDPRHGRYWVGSCAIAVLTAVLAEAFIPRGNALAPAVLTALTAMNLLGFGAYVLLPGLIYGHRIRTIEQQIASERDAHLAQTQEALERQTATADILKVIAGSPSDVQPVFEAVVNSAARLFEPCSATISTLKDGKLHWNAFGQLVPSFDHEAARAVYPIPFDPGSITLGTRHPGAPDILQFPIHTPRTRRNTQEEFLPPAVSGASPLCR